MFDDSAEGDGAPWKWKTIKSMLFRLCGVALCASLLLRAGRGQSQARLVGTVEDVTGRHSPGATITLISLDRVLRVKSGADGSFALDGVPFGVYDVEATAPGFAKTRMPLSFTEKTAAEPLAIVVTVGMMPDMGTCGPHSTVQYEPLQAAGPHLTGVIRHYWRKRPIANAEVSIWQAAGREPALTTKSDKQGRYTFDPLPSGRYKIRISRAGYLPQSIEHVTLPRENAVSIDTTLLPLNKMVACQ